MKYFLTEHGLEPFDMSAEELTRLLIDNNTILPENNTNADEDTISDFYYGVGQMMEHKLFIFRYPDVSFDRMSRIICEWHGVDHKITQHGNTASIIGHIYRSSDVNIVACVMPF